MLPGKLPGCWRLKSSESTTLICVMRPWPFSSPTVGRTVTSEELKVARHERRNGANGTLQARASARSGEYCATSWMGAVIHRGVSEHAMFEVPQARIGKLKKSETEKGERSYGSMSRRSYRPLTRSTFYQVPPPALSTPHSFMRAGLRSTPWSAAA